MQDWTPVEGEGAGAGLDPVEEGGWSGAGLDTTDSLSSHIA